MSDPRRALRDSLEPGAVVVVISGPGGVGKGTLVGELLARDPRLHVNRSWTTRRRRPGESRDAYHFATREEFEERARSGGFLEWVEFLDYLQGSPVPDPPPGHDVLFEVDVAGGARIKELFDGAVLVFVDAPDRATQAERMRHRGDDEDRISQRIERAEQEVRAARELPYATVINDDLDRAVKEVAGLIETARAAAR